ncbi:serine proteinase inhibitor [Ancylostoma caninum]|uniref:Serine proteinase inhibitor n=1 Tax=Ancylostoma caninum TaxID=29170 RepID=A0A368GBH4_ANCCA|nr:serine proteinase inhibitor [Ancylostoma caninum]
MAASIKVDRAFLNAETDFGLNMLRQSPVNEQLVVSPISVIFALTMVQAGAKGKTKRQINRVISKGATDDAIVEFYSNLAKETLKASNGVQTRIANAFFMEWIIHRYFSKKYAIEEEYADTITQKYSAKVEALDFGKAKQTAQTIDAFVSENTAGKIKNLIKEDTVKDAFSLIINAIYFSAEWEYEFSKCSSSKKIFYSTENAKKEIEFLNEYRVFRYYAEDQDMQVLSLRYRDTTYAFNIILPQKRFGLDALRKELNGEGIQRVLSELELTYMTISIPKMKVETDFKLKEALIAMGVTEMFSDYADLTGISKAPSLKVSDAAHKAIFEIDEEGTTAAAATSLRKIPASFISQSGEPQEFIADQPFIFILTKSGNPLFMGQFV